VVIIGSDGHGVGVYTDFIINQPTTALFYNLQHVSTVNYLAIIREDAFLRQQAAYVTLVNDWLF
jgi:hypothetical protein